MTAIADSLDAIGARVAVANVPDVTLAPHMTFGRMFWCFNNTTQACGPQFPAGGQPPFNSPLFIVSSSCAPGAAGGKGDSTMVAFPTTAGIAQALAAGAGILLDCAGDSVRINTGGGFVPPTAFPSTTVSPTEYAAIRTAVSQYNAAIATLAGRTNWTLVDVNAALGAAAAAGQIPPFPNLAVLQRGNPNLLFGTPFGAPTVSIFSQDGFHPNINGQRLLAQAFGNAINGKWGTTLSIP
jgi:hypothetical protein